MTLLCITHSMDGVRSCTIRGYHLANTDEGHEDRPGHTCRGCLPRPAEVGLLCRFCFDKFEAALVEGRDLIPHLRSIERAGQSVDGVRTTTVVQPTIPQSWLEADTLWRLLASVLVADAFASNTAEPKWPHWTSPAVGFSFSATVEQVMSAVSFATNLAQSNPTGIVSRDLGAEAAVRFYRGIQRALAMFPLEEKVKAERWIRCKTCNDYTIQDVPPLYRGDDRLLKCRVCGGEYDDTFTKWDMRVLAEEGWSRLSEDQREALLDRLQPDEAKVLDDAVKVVLLLSAVEEPAA